MPRLNVGKEVRCDLARFHAFSEGLTYWSYDTTASRGFASRMVYTLLEHALVGWSVPVPAALARDVSGGGGAVSLIARLRFAADRLLITRDVVAGAVDGIVVDDAMSCSKTSSASCTRST